MLRHRFFVWLLLAAVSLARADDIALVSVGEVWRFSPGIIEPSVPATAWREANFMDEGWLRGESGFGFTSYGENTQLGDSTGLFTSAYFRKAFTVADPSQVRSLTLRLDWQGGFVAFLNGQEILRQNLTNNEAGYVPFNQLAGGRAAGGAVDFDVSAFTTTLHAGANVLAIQLHGAGDLGSRLVLVPELLANFTRGPMVQNVFTDRADIAWQTPAALTGRVEFGPTVALGSVASDAVAKASHAVTLEGLVPGARYFYRVVAVEGNRSVASPTFSFQTMPTSGDVSFLLIGDSGAGTAGQFAVARQLTNRPADFVGHLGDIVYPQFSFPYADTRYLSVYRWLMRSTPMFCAWGNHDLYAGTRPMLEIIRPPTNNVAAADHATDHTLPQFYYSFDAGDAHFAFVFQPYMSQYTLTTNSPQYRWLEADLLASRKPWKFMLLHLPLNSSGSHRFDDYNFNGLNDNRELAAVLYPLAARTGVQAVFSGHDHNYQRFQPLNGVHHFISGGGGSVLYGQSQRDPANPYFASRYHLCSVQITGGVFRLSAIGDRGEVFDALEFRRPAPGSEDPDGDGLGNDMEAMLGTNPGDPDTDGDGLPDGWEWIHGTDPKSSTGVDGAQGSLNQGGLSNLGALISIPPSNDPAVLSWRRAADGTLGLRWTGAAGQLVKLESAPEPNGDYLPVPEFGLAHSVTSGRQGLELPVNASARFYRLRVLP